MIPPAKETVIRLGFLFRKLELVEEPIKSWDASDYMRRNWRSIDHSQRMSDDEKYKLKIRQRALTTEYKRIKSERVKTKTRRKLSLLQRLSIYVKAKINNSSNGK